ncbi:MAG: UDP-N-acetylglucosamine--N-acetylmuramyl-(pentapeptide)pyrophosphoryl-undecaprenol [Candidatus Magasanikbacteria bacterium]|nr:UDP-N-acetylglucosamine--N-acetylmuramyl-(pentapeptide)pyrophosphoryl-undecaprenol [Candidatus Magasanikbacteria bacterium]
MHTRKYSAFFPMKILFTGGGTLGPVTPLLAVAEFLTEMASRRGQTAEFLWIGTKNGPERALVKAAGIKFTSIPAAKVDRFFSWRNLFLPVAIFGALVKSFSLILQFKPDVLVSAGGYTAVPVHLAGKILGVRGVIHQQDLTGGITNRVLAPLANQITVAWEKLKEKFPRAIWIGNPVRREIFHGAAERARTKYKVRPESRVVLAFGGGTGATSLNFTVNEMSKNLPNNVELIHLCGIGKLWNFKETDQYHPAEFDAEMGDLYASADLVIARAGMGTIAEVAALGKAAVLVPLTDSPQEENAAALEDADAAVVVRDLPHLARVVRDLLLEPEKARLLGENIKKVFPSDAAERLAEIILGIYEK